MTEQQQPEEITERQTELAKRLNEGMAQQLGKMTMDIIAIRSELSLANEEKLILAEHVQQQAEQIEQLRAMLSLQEGPTDAAEIAPNREQRRAAEKAKTKVQKAPEQQDKT